MVPFSFGLRMAALGSQKELIDLETWLSINLVIYKDTLCEVLCLDLPSFFCSGILACQICILLVSISMNALRFILIKQLKLPGVPQVHKGDSK